MINGRWRSFLILFLVPMRKAGKREITWWSYQRGSGAGKVEGRTGGRSNYRAPEEKTCSFTLCLNINFVCGCVVWCVSRMTVSRLLLRSQDKPACNLQGSMCTAMVLASHWLGINAKNIRAPVQVTFFCFVFMDVVYGVEESTMLSQMKYSYKKSWADRLILWRARWDLDPPFIYSSASGMVLNPLNFRCLWCTCPIWISHSLVSLYRKEMDT